MSLLRRLLTLKGGGGKLIKGVGSAYFDLVGTIWMQEQGGYFNHTGGKVALYVDEPQGWGGGYFNR